MYSHLHAEFPLEKYFAYSLAAKKNITFKRAFVALLKKTKQYLKKLFWGFGVRWRRAYFFQVLSIKDIQAMSL